MTEKQVYAAQLSNRMGWDFPPEEERITDRAIEDEDLVNIDYVGSMDGVEFEGGNSSVGNDEGANVVAGSDQFIDDFLTQIIGHSPGETFDVNVTFPDPYPNNLDFSGKPAVFVVTVNYIIDTEEIREEILSELENGEYDELIKNNNQGIIRDYIEEVMLDTTITTIPESVLEMNYGDEMMAHLLLVVAAIAEDMELAVTEEDVIEFMIKIEISEISEAIDELGLSYWKFIVMFETVLDYIEDNAVYVDTVTEETEE
jgi:trigger factor